MDLRYTHSGSTRVMGNIVLAAGLLISLLMISPDNPSTGGYVLAALLVMTGLGLRLEAALLALRDDGQTR
ncbi:hypothetical protein OG989_10875 [Micromonospora sp. NBC_01740]|uniref:hypothetical protein n=1 Tax=Micromonospora sp. NBC_01740 TaxID=2975986 RepID=UPI002E1210CB|nr:hypothetical protein OG989_10875 [Micromonospora sp. NBC_01740]